ncbi:MAG: P1 family peptidase [Ancalomicrobiaceae bacterium]|nr:P1 family peptidase [Ancalomicrobiaceae bacterium]
MMRPGPQNSILDVAGLTVGHAEDPRLKSGVSTVIADEPAVAAIHVMGGAPGTRDSDLLAPEQTVSHVDALVLSGGSAFGLDAVGGVQAWLAGRGRGFAVGSALVPIVPGAILFDLLNGGDKAWGRFSPYRDLGFAAAAAATSRPFQLGSVGAGCGATTATVKGGLGTASMRLANGTTVAALVAVNAVGSGLVADGLHFWAAPFEIDGEFGGLGCPHPWPEDATVLRLKGVARPGPETLIANTTIAIVATDAVLSKPEAKRLAVMAHDGFARALYPAHTPFDGDLVFALATGHRPLAGIADLVELGVAGANVLARAIARGIHAASPAPGDLLPSWSELAAKRRSN